MKEGDDPVKVISVDPPPRRLTLRFPLTEMRPEFTEPKFELYVFASFRLPPTFRVLPFSSKSVPYWPAKVTLLLLTLPGAICALVKSLIDANVKVAGAEKREYELEIVKSLNTDSDAAAALNAPTFVNVNGPTTVTLPVIVTGLLPVAIATDGRLVRLTRSHSSSAS